MSILGRYRAEAFPPKWTAGLLAAARERLARKLERRRLFEKRKWRSAKSRWHRKSVVFRISVEKLLRFALKDTAEVVLAITKSGLYSSVETRENAGEDLHHRPVVRELKVLGAVGKNGEEGFTARLAVKLDSTWNLENLRAVAFVQGKKESAYSGSPAARVNDGKPGVALETKKEKHA
jgi:hypothetical protein